ncbi:MAG: hypothetical protein M1835_005853 [Candelina submexicana]|nr:MAG: hypothetical protein M1835_005853 [Candelina submexicana]
MAPIQSSRHRTLPPTRSSTVKRTFKMGSLQGKKLYTRALVGGGIAMMTFGWDAGVLGGILLTPEFQSAMGMPNTTTISMITSVFLLASWLGCIIMSLVGMVQGRRMWILIGNLVSVVGSVVSACSYSSGQLIVGRIIVGIGNGLITSMVPSWAAEMAIDKSKRGQGVNSMIASATVATALAYWIDFGMVFAHSQAVWRFPVAFQIVFSIGSTAVLWPLPDTPRWYYARGRISEGDSVLERLFTTAISDPGCRQAKLDIFASLELEQSGAAGLRLKDFFWDTLSPRARTPYKTPGPIKVYKTNSSDSIDMIFYYTTTIFQLYIGLAPLKASALAGAATTVLSICNWAGVFCFERLGRKTWLIGGATAQTVFMAVFVAMLANPGAKTGAAAASMLFCWIAVFGPTWAPLSYVYASDIMPLRYRHIGFSLSVSCQWLFAFITVFAGPIAAADKNVGWKVWIWFLVFNFLSIFYVWFACPETRGKSLEEIDLLFISDRLRSSEAAKTLDHASSSSSSAYAAHKGLRDVEDVGAEKDFELRSEEKGLGAVEERGSSADSVNGRLATVESFEGGGGRRFKEG